MQIKVPSLDRGTVFHFLHQALSEVLSPSPDFTCDYEQLMVRTLGILWRSDVVEKSQPSANEAFRTLMSTNPSLAILLTEAYQQLFTFGYLVPSPVQSAFPLSLYRFAVTETGRRWAASTDPIPEDQQGYLATLLKSVPTVDPVIRQYVEEALLTYDRGALFAAAVMIGAASEKTLYLLAECIQAALSNPKEKKSIETTIKSRKLNEMFTLIRNHIKRGEATKVIPYAVHEGASAHLASLQEAIRVHRNDAVHPEAGQVERVAVRLALSAFPAVCKKVYDLMEWFNKNPDSL